MHSLLLLFLGSTWAFTTLGSVRRHSVNRDILDEARIVEVDQSRDRNVVLLDIIVIQDGLDGLLDLGRRDALVILGRALWHIKIKLQDVVKLVARVQVTETLGDTRVL